MAISSKFGTSAGNATVSGTLDVKDPVMPVAPPDGLQAIGPRVTFHFTGLWDKNTDYIYYDVAKDGSDNSYIAIKPKVPAGTALTDSEYWFKFDAPNQQFYDLEQTVETYKASIDKNTNSIATLDSQMAATADSGLKTLINTDVDAIHEMIKDDETLITNNTQNIAKNTANIETKMPKRNIILLGDSFSAGIYLDSDGTYKNSEYGWANYIWLYNKKYAGIENIYYASKTVRVGNAAFTGSQKWLTTIQDMATDGTIADTNSITEIYALGGTNETVSALDSAINEFMTAVKTLYPNAKVFIGCLGSDISGKLTQVSYVYGNCSKYGAVYLPQTLMLFNNPAWVGSDGTHLTAEGYQHYAATISNIVIGNVGSYNDIYNIVYSEFSEGVSARTNVSCNVFSTENECKFTLSQYGNPYPARLTLTGVTALNQTKPLIPNFKKKLSMCNLDNCKYDCFCKFTTTNSKFGGNCSVYYDATSDSLVAADFTNLPDFDISTLTNIEITLPMYPIINSNNILIF